MRVGDVPIGDGAPLALISGLNVIESEDGALQLATELSDISSRCGIPIIFKASFDKANRSSWDSYRGPGLEKGLRVLERVKTESGLPLLTDVHEPSQAAIAAEVADCLQIPAFLCRQTDLIAACAENGQGRQHQEGTVRGARRDRASGAESAEAIRRDERPPHRAGNGLRPPGSRGGHARICSRMRRAAPVCFDATHSAQFPGAGNGSSSGEREMVAPLARAAVAVGIDALFVEVHRNPAEAPCDAALPTELRQPSNGCSDDVSLQSTRPSKARSAR